MPDRGAANNQQTAEEGEGQKEPIPQSHLSGEKSLLNKLLSGEYGS
jgi:hypothetical protein